eukprot:127082-Amphidinium_carterae.1
MTKVFSELDDIFLAAWKHLSLDADEKKLVLRQAYDHFEAGMLFKTNFRKNLPITENPEEAIHALPLDEGLPEHLAADPGQSQASVV